MGPLIATLIRVAGPAVAMGIIMKMMQRKNTASPLSLPSPGGSPSPVPPNTPGIPSSWPAPNLKPGILSTLGGMAATGSGLLLNTAGNAVNAAGTIGGAAAQGVGKLPGYMAKMIQSPQQREVYGSNPITMAADIAQGVGDVAGVAVPAVTGVAGNVLGNIGDLLSLIGVQNRVYNNMLHQGSALRRIHSGDPTANLPASAFMALQSGVSNASKLPKGATP